MSLDISSRNLIILYGSETGTAQEVSENVWRESKRYHFRGSVKSMNEYDVRNLIDERLVLFVCSTTGIGEEPENMKLFWKYLLRKSLPSDSLSKLNFGVIGLGDSSYQKFNFVAKRLHKRLLHLGASPLLPTALCDDQHDLGIGGVLYPWITNFWSKVNEIYPLPIGINPLPKSTRTTRWNVIKVKTLTAVEEHFDIYGDFEETTFEGNVEVIENKRTTALDHFQDVRLISFSPGNLSWSVGDVAYIRPRNSDETVKCLFEILNEHNLDFCDDYVMLEDDEEIPAPSVLKKPLPFKIIATQFWDLSARPKPRAFEVLSYNCENELEKEKLLEFSSFEGQEELLAYVNRPRRTILEVLNDFPHATSKLTLELLFELFQPIKPRAFSIASSVHSNRLDVLVAVVEYYSRLKAQRKGLCSNWLKSLQVKDRIKISVKKGTFQFPKELDTPIIMVGPGTGLAIFRAILQDAQLTGNYPENKFVLFFGCRYGEKDFHCREELKSMEADGKLKLFCAFSRDKDHKVYVQDLISNEKSLLKNLIIQRGGYFYVSGSSKNMPKAVKEALEEALENKDYVADMIKSGRYQEETWT